MAELKLYHYWRSSSSWRVRWALAIKNIAYESIAINLLEKEHKSRQYKQKVAMGFVPCLEVDGVPFSESTAIIEWLEEEFPEPNLLPKNKLDRLKVRQLAMIIACGTQPLQNLSAQIYYSDNKEKRKEYAQHWIKFGLDAYEKSIESTACKYSFGDNISLADLCLMPQCYNALRFGVDIKEFTKLYQVYNNCLLLESYKNSHPDNQPGAIVSTV